MNSEIKKYLFVLFLLILNYLFAQPDWRKYGWQIFDNASDARSIAIGNSSVADIHINSTLWNPAIIGVGNSTNLTYGHQSRFAGIIQSDILSYPFSSKVGKSFNLIVLHESVGKIPNTQDLLLDWGADGVPNTGDFGENNGYLDDGERLDNNKVSYFNQHQFGIQLNTNILIFDTDVGVGIKSLVHTIGDNWGTGIGLDIGLIKSIWENTNVGLSIRNVIPGMMVWDSGTFELTKPQAIVGASQIIDISPLNTEILILGDLVFNISDESLNDDFNIGSSGGNYRIGAEFSYNDKMKIRFGRNQYGYISTGLGLSWSNFDLNYGYQLNSNSADLGSNHVISFDLNPSWLYSIFQNNINK